LYTSLQNSPAAGRSLFRRSFITCFLTAVLLFLPFVIVDEGFFLYCGDFNSQQLPFSYYLTGMLQQARQTGIFPTYCWATDLGSGFTESYSFYLLGSPFFRLASLLPQSWSPYLMVPLLCLKFAFAGAGACLWSRRYLTSPISCQLVGVLYAFSGFSVYNIFFNHFVDVVAVFPYLLWSVDSFFFAPESRQPLPYVPFAVALCLAVNYFFFVGQAVFLILYFVIRAKGEEWRPSLRKLALFALQVVLGVCMAAFLALPSFFQVLANPRVNSFSFGYNLILYRRTQQYLAILSSALLPPDPAYLPNLFSDCSVKWTSMSLYLPFVSMSGVLVYLRTHKKSCWKKLLLTCGVMAIVPVLNSAYYAFNSSYYCRWYYMPLLIMALVTARALEEAPRQQWLSAVRSCTLLTAVFLLSALLPDQDGDGNFTLGAEDSLTRLLISLAIAAGSLLLLYLLLNKLKDRRSLLVCCGVLAGAIGCISGIFVIAAGKLPQQAGDADYPNETYIWRVQLKDWLDNADDSYYRIDTWESYTNLGLWLDRSNIQFFNSTVDPAIMEFYPSVGISRDVASEVALDRYALRGLLGVKYLLTPSDRLAEFYEADTHSGDWVEVTQIGPYSILEYQYYLPMGSCYEYYITPQQLEAVREKNRANLLLRALVLSEEQVAAYGDWLQPLSDESCTVVSYHAYSEDIADRQQSCCDSFVTDTTGFTAHINTDKDTLVFFPVPYNQGWSATVNGSSAPVEKVDNGLMAIPVRAGDNTLRLEYSARGARAGKIISVVAVLAGLIWMVAEILYRRQNRMVAFSGYWSKPAPAPTLPDWDLTDPPTNN